MTTVLITGANRGLGLEFAHQYKDAGVSVIATCRDPAKAAALMELGVRVEALNVTDSTSIAALAAKLNGEPIDIVINNAGVWGPQQQSANSCPPEAMLDVFAVNTVAPLMLSRALKPNLLAGRDKKLIFITSKMGSISDSSGGVVAYRASKAALNIVAHGLASDWSKDGILVGVFHPGWVQTDMGGPGAPLLAPQSIEGLRARIAELDRSTSGRFIAYDGAEIGW